MPESNMMEELLHYVWKHRLLPLESLRTDDGKEVEVIDPGLHNRNAGPDFFNAKVRIGGTLWVGNVEIHLKPSDWFLHGHDKDSAYDNVILHVVGEAGPPVTTHSGSVPPQLVLQVPQSVKDHYGELLTTDNYPPCYRIIPKLPRLTVHSWMSALQTERLEEKTEAIRNRASGCDGSWEDAYFITLARTYGFGINGEAFETWAKAIPMRDVDHVRDDLFQIEALFFGQAGLLEPESLTARHREEAMGDAYFRKLRSEYRFLAHKYSLRPIDYKLWRFLRLRPQNFPYIRISQLATLCYHRRCSLSALIDCTTLKEAKQLLVTSVSPYWENHYTFGAASAKRSKRLSDSSLLSVIINAAIPMLFAYGRHRDDDRLCDRAFDFLEQLRAEDNHIVRMWKDCGLTVDNAGDSQALIQLKNSYCDRRDCLRCRFGYEYLKQL